MNLSSDLTPAQRAYLDLVRALAALLVLFGHAAHFFLGSSFLAIGQAQGAGVYIFFLISGFLISYSLFRKHDDARYGFRAYFIDRFCRIYSAFLPALVFVLLLDSLVRHSPDYAWARDYNAQTWFGNLLMLQDFPLFQVARRLGVPDQSWFVSSFGSARPFWTISIEWWIYMLFGGVVCFLIRGERRLRRAGWLLLAFVAIEPAYYFIGGYDGCLSILWLIGMAASLGLIALPRLADRYGVTRRRLLRAALIAAVGAAFAMAGRLFADRMRVGDLQFGLFLAVFLFALLLALGIAETRVPAALSRAVGFLAGYSYSLYLTHHTLLEFIALRFPGHGNSPAVFWSAILAANLLAILFWAFFERHHRRIAQAFKRWTAQRRPHLAVTPLLRH